MNAPVRRWSHWLLLVAVMWLPLTGCSVNPATGQRQFNMMSTGQEVSMGQQAAPEFLQSYGGPVPSPAINQYVSNIGAQLAAKSERPDLPWEFHVVDSQVINAFALPGGKVFMSRGLLAEMDNEAQLAGVLGHEVGHVTAQHIGQQMSRAMLLQGLAIGLAVAGEATDRNELRVLGIGAQMGGAVYLLKFGRDQESQADSLGMRYMSRVGYNPSAQLQVMEILAGASKGGRQPEMLSTHPYPETRISRIKAELASNYSDYNSGKYEFHQSRFQTQVLRVLATLPPPRHTGEEQQASAGAAAGQPAFASFCWHCQQGQRAGQLARADHHD